jgi:hypothetical protein
MPLTNIQPLIANFCHGSKLLPIKGGNKGGFRTVNLPEHLIRFQNIFQFFLIFFYVFSSSELYYQ